MEKTPTKLLRQAHQKTQFGKSLSPGQIGHFRSVFEEILKQRDRVNPRALAYGKRGQLNRAKRQICAFAYANMQTMFGVSQQTLASH